MEPSLQELKRRFLRLLDEDVEFRYTVAGYLGLSEILKRLDGIEAEQLRLREEMAQMREEFSKRFEAHEQELIALREDFNRMQKTIEGMQKMIADMQKTMIGMQETIADMQKTMIETQETIAGMQKVMMGTQETIKGILGRLEQLDRRLTRVERTLEKLTLDIEEEARSFVAHRLKQMGYDIRIGSLVLPELEVNIYGASGDVCVVGEASVRAGVSTLRDLRRKLSVLEESYPGLLRPKVILIIYTSLATPELVEEAGREGVWVLKATGDIVPLPEGRS